MDHLVLQFPNEVAESDPEDLLHGFAYFRVDCSHLNNPPFLRPESAPWRPYLDAICALAQFALECKGLPRLLSLPFQRPARVTALAEASISAPCSVDSIVLPWPVHDRSTPAAPKGQTFAASLPSAAAFSFPGLAQGLALLITGPLSPLTSSPRSPSRGSYRARSLHHTESRARPPSCSPGRSPPRCSRHCR